MHLDGVLCELVERLVKSGYKDTLEVEIQAEFVELHENACVYHKEFLLKFRERGRVSVLELRSGERWEWS